jgi:hypothetical protein
VVHRAAGRDGAGLAGCLHQVDLLRAAGHGISHVAAAVDVRFE